MPKIREIKSRIRAVTNIQRITKTMQMIATARFQAAQKRATSSQPYARKLAELVGELAAALVGRQGEGQSISHPLLNAPQPAVGRRLVLVLTSNRGLCGAYNGNVLRTAMRLLRDTSGGGGETDLEVVGKKGIAFFRFNKIPVSEFHSQFTDKPKFEDVDNLAQRYMRLFTAGRYDSVRVVSMSFVSMSRQIPRVLELLPLQNPTAGKSGPSSAASPFEDAAPASAQYDFYPDAGLLLGELLPLTVKAQLFQCFIEAAVSEHISRMVAMKSATDAAGKMKKNLSRQYNRARQSGITKELLEIIAGAEGLK